MSKNLSIDVNVNPNGVASPTETRVTEQPESTKSTQRTMGNAAVVAGISRVAQQSLRLATSNIGAITGSKTLQRQIQGVTMVANLGVTAMLNPLAAGVMITGQLASKAIQISIENRNTEADIRYNQILRSTTYNNSRR
jgi:hypothetical protein